MEHYFLRPLSDAELRAFRALANTRPQPEEDRILGYLEGGVGLAATTPFPDRLGDGEDVTSFATFSDGEWAWSNALLYYVRKYHLTIEAEFLAHMRDRDWNPALPPGMNTDNLMERLDDEAWDE